MYLRLAWRNIGRNRRRSAIVLLSMFVGVTATVFMGGVDRGFMQQMLDNQIGMHVGHVTIRAPGFTANKSVDHFLASDSVTRAALGALPIGTAFSSRTISYGLLSSAGNSSGITIVGVDPAEERRVTTLHGYLVAGRYLGGGPNEIVIGTRLAKTLDARLGDRLVVMGTTPDGTVGSDMVRVAGIYESPSSSFDRMYAYVPRATAQGLLRCGDRVAELCLRARGVAEADTLAALLRARMGPGCEVLSYKDMLPMLLQQLEMMDGIMLVFTLVIGFAMMFGIVNTLLMSVFERIREFGILKCIGMGNGTVLLLIELEALLLGLIGSAAGAATGALLTLWAQHSGLDFSWFSEGLKSYGSGAVIYPTLDVAGTLQIAAVITLLCVFSALYPALRTMRLVPVRAAHHL